jgi:hypothetical protein
MCPYPRRILWVVEAIFLPAYVAKFDLDKQSDVQIMSTKGLSTLRSLMVGTRRATSVIPGHCLV